MAATVSELEVVAVANMSRDDILALWGVPATQAGIATPAGLNSGAVKGFDEAILWQGAIHPRLRAFQETLQYGLLDRLPMKLDLELEEPEFDDDAPRYALLKNSENTALTNAEGVLDKANQARAVADLRKQAMAEVPMRLARDAARSAIERSFAMPLKAAGIGDARVIARFASEDQSDPSYIDQSRSYNEVLDEARAKEPKTQ